MLMRSFEEAKERAGEIAKKGGPKKVSVLGAHSREFLLALKEAWSRGYAEPVLIGDERKIREIAEEINFDISKFTVINLKDPQKIADRGVELVERGKADFVLRGYIEGAPAYRSLISTSSKRGLKKQISVVALMQFPSLSKLIGLTDPGINIAPDFKAKTGIIKNAIDLFHHFGYECPQVGIIAARRWMNDELDSISDAVRIRKVFVKGEFPECCFSEGLSLSDFLLGTEGFLEGFDEIDYSRIPDIILVDNLEFGNIYGKISSIAERDFFSNVRKHGIIVGAGIPAVVPSRADTHNVILTDIAIGVLIS